MNAGGCPFPPKTKMQSTSESEEYAEWKDLLTVLLAAIAKRLTSPADYCSFRGVCASWRSAAAFDNFDRGFPRVPHLLYFVEEKEETPVLGDAVAEKREETPIQGDALAEKREESPVPGDALAEKSEETRDDVAEVEGSPILGDEEIISGKNVKKIVSNLWDLESDTRQITGFPAGGKRLLSCSGWILCVSEDYSEVCLKHFMLPINIKLPSLDEFFSKMVLSGSPLELGADLVVMVIWGYDDELAFCRPGDESWTVIDYWGDRYRNFYDIIYHDNKLYSLDGCLTVWECHVHGSNPTKSVQKVFAFPDHDSFDIDAGVSQSFLVESNAKFLIVLRCRTGYDNERLHIRMYEIDFKYGGYNKIDNLEGRCLFLGSNSSMCVEFPAACALSREKLKPNCIYVASYRPRANIPNVGVYSLCDGSYEDFCAALDLCYPQPIWVLPTI